MFNVDLKTMIAAVALGLTIGGGVLTIKLDIGGLKSDVARLDKTVTALSCEITPRPECRYSVATDGR